MDIKYECLPCITKQAIRIATKVTDDVEKQRDIIGYGLEVVSKHALKSNAPYVTALISAYASKVSGVKDSYYEEKKRFNKIAENIIEEFQFKTLIDQSEDPLDTAVRLSIAGNIIDFGLGIEIKESHVRESVDKNMTCALFGLTTDVLRDKINKARKIMIIADNSGEIVFDKLLVNQLPREKVVYAVKGGPIVNDATMEDVIEVGMDKLVDVVDSGVAIQGTFLEECSDEFMKVYSEADLIISKGQANFETLSGVKHKDIVFLLRAKCKCVADEIGCETGDFVMCS